MFLGMLWRRGGRSGLFDNGLPSSHRQARLSPLALGHKLLCTLISRLAPTPCLLDSREYCRGGRLLELPTGSALPWGSHPLQCQLALSGVSAGVAIVSCWDDVARRPELISSIPGSNAPDSPAAPASRADGRRRLGSPHHRQCHGGSVLHSQGRGDQQNNARLLGGCVDDFAHSLHAP